MRTQAPVLAPVFRSEGQARLLSAVLLGSEEISIADAAVRSGVAYPTAYAEAQRLLQAGIFRERRAGRTRMLSANLDSPLVEPLRSILLIATGPRPLLSEELAKIDGVSKAFIYGSFAARSVGRDGPAPHDIDLMVVGRPEVEAVYAACARVERAVGRPVNPTIMSEVEYAEPSGFLQSVREGPVLAVVGDAP